MALRYIGCAIQLSDGAKAKARIGSSSTRKKLLAILVHLRLIMISPWLVPEIPPVAGESGITPERRAELLKTVLYDLSRYEIDPRLVQNSILQNSQVPPRPRWLGVNVSTILADSPRLAHLCHSIRHVQSIHASALIFTEFT